MRPTHFIGQHLKDSDIEKPIASGDMVCKLCGCKSGAGVSGMISDVFTDISSFQHPESELVCLNCAKCIGKITVSEGRKTFFRNFSFVCTSEKLELLKREDILDIIINPPDPPFILCVTFSYKKHMSFKANIQTDRRRYAITTDIGGIDADADRISEILPIIQAWYTICGSTAAQPTFFNKEEILNGSSNYKKIMEYGMEKYFEENQKISRWRGTLLLKLLVFALNKGEQTTCR